MFRWFPVSPHDKECCIECLVSLSLSFRNRIKEYLKILFNSNKAFDVSPNSLLEEVV